MVVKMTPRHVASFLAFLLCFFSIVSNAAPAVPELTYSINGPNITIAWTNIPDATAYKLSYAPDPYTGPDSVGSIDMGMQTSFSVLLWEEAAFFIAVQAVNNQGMSEFSNIENFKIPTPNTNPLPAIQLTADLIVDEPKNPGKFELSSEAFMQDTGILDLGIEFAGKTSLAYDKKNFNIELVESDDPTEELDLALLDLREDGDWRLQAAYIDTSFVRDLIAHDIFNNMRLNAYIANGEQEGQATVRGRPAEVFLNDHYHGIYILSEKIDRKLLDLKKIKVPKDTDGNKLFDQIDFSDEENGSVLYKAGPTNLATLDFIESARIDFIQKYPDVDDIARWEPLEDLINFINLSSDVEFIDQIGNMVDIDSAVDIWLMTMVISNADSFKKNYYLARSGSGKFFFVPWDNEASFGIWWTGERWDLFDYWDLNRNALIRRLSTLTQTGFNAKVKQRWYELKDNLFSEASLIARFETYHAQLDSIDTDGKSARERNRERWLGSGAAGVNNPETGELAFIRAWLRNRLQFIDTQINEL